MNILDSLYEERTWQGFLQYKIEKQHLSGKEQKQLEDYIHEKTYYPLLKEMEQEKYEFPIPMKKEINKGGTSKKRVVYSYPDDFNTLLKIIAFSMYKYDGIFSNNCYAFRRNFGVKDAMKRIRNTKGISKKYCLKVDISNYFNSIDVAMLLEKLIFLKRQDANLYDMFERILTADKAVVCMEKDSMPSGNVVVEEKRGAMAGIPISPFFANVYLAELDRYFEEQDILYFRYSDDILIFADSIDDLKQYQEILYNQIAEHHLSLNPSKVQISTPGEMWEFLGFCYRNEQVDLSDNTKRKIKGKIKRKAQALRRWQEKKGLSGDKAAKGFIKAMNHKFFDCGDGTEFSWTRWFFPNLTTADGLAEIDVYMQQYIRYCVTGRHYKGNYRVTYEQMKEWGYRNLVHEYYAHKNEKLS